ncbi:hypothetical protein BC628DRAFT_723953 [Trametes gibbosa]|nr:hypothetical protein BC628DRAFT_723953 [Trametes gibbosa]
MPYGYFPTPARSEPGHRVGGLCTNVSPDLEPRFASARLRRTHSVPSTLAAPNVFNWQRQPRVGLGLDLGLPNTLVTHFHPRPERPRLRRQVDQLGPRVPLAIQPTRSMRRRVAGSYPASAAEPTPVATPPPTRRPRNAGHPLRPVAPPPSVEPARRHQRVNGHVDENEQPHPAITLTLADAFDSESDSDDAPLYSFLPPGLDALASRPAPNGTLSPDDNLTPPATPTPTATARPRPRPRPMLFRTLASPAIHAPFVRPGDVSPPSSGSGSGAGAPPLSPSVSRFGTHHHFPGLDHSAGGAADGDALFARPREGSGRRIPRTAVPMPPPGTPHMGWVERFA